MSYSTIEYDQFVLDIAASVVEGPGDSFPPESPVPAVRGHYEDSSIEPSRAFVSPGYVLDISLDISSSERDAVTGSCDSVAAAYNSFCLPAAIVPEVPSLYAAVPLCTAAVGTRYSSPRSSIDGPPGPTPVSAFSTDELSSLWLKGAGNDTDLASSRQKSLDAAAQLLAAVSAAFWLPWDLLLQTPSSLDLAHYGHNVLDKARRSLERLGKFIAERGFHPSSSSDFARVTADFLRNANALNFKKMGGEDRGTSARGLRQGLSNVHLWFGATPFSPRIMTSVSVTAATAGFAPSPRRPLFVTCSRRCFSRSMHLHFSRQSRDCR